MCSRSCSSCVVPPALRRKDAVKEFSFLPKWQFPNSTQQKCAKKAIAEHWNEGGRSMAFLQGVFHTHWHSFWISASFFRAEKQQLQSWPGTGTQSIALVTFMPRFTWVGIFLSLFFRLFFYLFIWSSVSGCCSRAMAFGQHPELCPQL